MNEKTVAKVLRKASDILKADSDYIYDPQHKNRPHGGGTWYKTEKGWSTNPQDKKMKGDSADHRDPLIKSLGNKNLSEDELMGIAENLGMVQNDDEKGRELNRKFYSHPNLPPSYIEKQFDSLIDSGATYGANTGYSDAWDDFFDIVERRSDTSKDISHQIRKMKREYAQFGKEQRILERLSHDHSPMTREAVARNPHLGLKELDRLSNEDKDEDVRNAAFVTSLKLKDETPEDKEETNRLLKLNNWK